MQRCLRHDGGGIYGLIQLLAERWGLAEADFARYYGHDLRQLINTTGARRIWALVRGLPRDAALWREDVPGWTQAHELQAAQIEVTDAWLRAIWQVLYVQTFRKRPPNVRPVRIEHEDRRAAPATRRPVERNPQAIKRFFDQFARRN